MRSDYEYLDESVGEAVAWRRRTADIERIFSPLEALEASKISAATIERSIISRPLLYEHAKKPVTNRQCNVGDLHAHFSLTRAGFGSERALVAKSLSEDQKILHVLNRLGFGARPGDVEKVKKIGIDKYIEQQLNPASIDDSVAENKVKGLEIFNMSTAELFEKYPNPAALLRQLNGGKKAQADAQAKAADKAGNNQDPAAVTADQQRERRQELNELYRKYDLRPAGQILPQIVANRLIRAVYSERQLQEVMVNFWQNHFNVFAGKNAVRWYIPSYERDVLRKNALGNFKDLLTGTAMHPAMLFYLDNFQSVSPNAPQPGNNQAANNRLQQIIRNGGPLPQRIAIGCVQRGIT